MFFWFFLLIFRILSWKHFEYLGTRDSLLFQVFDQLIFIQNLKVFVLGVHFVHKLTFIIFSQLDRDPVPATDTKKLVIKLFDVDIDQVPLESFTGFLLFEFLRELFAGIVPLHIVVFIVEGFYKNTDIVVAT